MYIREHENHLYTIPLGAPNHQAEQTTHYSYNILAGNGNNILHAVVLHRLLPLPFRYCRWASHPLTTTGTFCPLLQGGMPWCHNRSHQAAVFVPKSRKWLHFHYAINLWNYLYCSSIPGNGGRSVRVWGKIGFEPMTAVRSRISDE